jgi:hypothetical protein
MFDVESLQVSVRTNLICMRFSDAFVGLLLWMSSSRPSWRKPKQDALAPLLALFVEFPGLQFQLLWVCFV